MKDRSSEGMLFGHIAGIAAGGALAARIADSVLDVVLVLCGRVFSRLLPAHRALRRTVVLVGMIGTVGAVITADRADLGAIVLVGVLYRSLLAADVTGRIAVVVVYVMRIA